METCRCGLINIRADTLLWRKEAKETNKILTGARSRPILQTLFEESTFEGSRDAAEKMKRFAKRQTKLDKECLLLLSLYVLIHSSNSERLSWPNSPIFVNLQFVDPNVLFEKSESSSRYTPLHHLAGMATPSNYVRM